MKRTARKPVGSCEFFIHPHGGITIYKLGNLMLLTKVEVDGLRRAIEEVEASEERPQSIDIQHRS
jgi:hypothetical protein